MKIVNWQPLFTDHQLFTWRALQGLVDEPITHVVGTVVSETRAKQGWKGADLSDLEVVVLERQGWWKRGTEIIRTNPDAVHVFCGFWADRRYFPLIVYALWHRSKVMIINESYSSQRVGYLVEGGRWLNLLKARLRPSLYRAAALLLSMATRGVKPAILAISMRAVEQFVRAGFQNDQVFPFGYFVPYLPAAKSQRPTGHALRLIFVGSLLPTKGLDVAIAAMKRCEQGGLEVSLDIYGTGDATKFVKSEMQSVVYRGTIPFGSAQSVIAQYDVLILPSRHDGWGVVVNEALLQGVPVIASENVGAACLVESNEAGAVFRNEDVAGLVDILLRLSSEPTLLRTWSANADKLKEHIYPVAAAKYMHDVMMFYFFQDGERPKLQCCEH
jgi:glycosyltransferase involved in cell wall biosynthesis